jgi:hypothetical protein
MKIQITMPDASGHNVGDVVEIDGNAIPSWAINKCRVVGNAKTAVTNPAKSAMPSAPTPKG